MQGKELQTFGDFYYQTNANGEAVILGAKIWTEILIIPAEINGHPVTEIGNGAFDTDAVMEQAGFAWDKGVVAEQLSSKLADMSIQQIARERIKEVRLPDTIQKIGTCAFYCNNALEKVNFPKGLKSIASCAFANTKLTKVQIPKNCEVYHEEGDEVWQEQGAFEGCGGYDEDGDIPADPEYGIEIEYI